MFKVDLTMSDVVWDNDISFGIGDKLYAVIPLRPGVKVATVFANIDLANIFAEEGIDGEAIIKEIDMTDYVGDVYIDVETRDDTGEICGMQGITLAHGIWIIPENLNALYFAEDWREIYGIDL